MLSAQTFRADIQAVSATEVQFSAVGGLTVQPIRIWAASGRQAVLTALPTAGVVTGEAGTKYVYAALAAPSGAPYGAAPGGLIDRWLNALPWNREHLQDTVKMLHPGDGTLLPSSRVSAVTLVITDSAVPPDTHHHPLGTLEWDGAVIESVTSYANAEPLSISTVSNGQCQLSLSGANLVLLPVDGQSLLIDNITRAVPTAGVTLAPTGLTPNTFYSIYAAWSGSMSLLASTVEPVTHSNGSKVMDGTPAHAYVGRAYIVAGPAWSTLIPVRSQFNAPDADLLIRAVGNPYKTVESSTTETSIFPAVPKIQGGPTISGAMEIVIFGDFLTTIGSTAFALRIKWGAETMLTLYPSTQFFLGNATRKGWHIIAYVSTLGTPSFHVARGYYAYTPNVPGITGGQSDDGNAPHYHATQSVTPIDALVEQPFDITIQNTHASAGVSCRVFSAIVRRIRRR